jgi:hypothetical protein
MIDFAHSFPSNHIDEAYLFGLKNLRDIFQNLDKEFGTFATISNVGSNESSVLGTAIATTTQRGK